MVDEKQVQEADAAITEAVTAFRRQSKLLDALAAYRSAS